MLLDNDSHGRSNGDIYMSMLQPSNTVQNTEVQPVGTPEGLKLPQAVQHLVAGHQHHIVGAANPQLVPQKHCEPHAIQNAVPPQWGATMTDVPPVATMTSLQLSS